MQKDKFFDYDEFVGKFEPKKTTDDCYTPPEVYDAVLGYCVDRFGIDPDKAVRPFYPGGDYEAFEYQDGCCVVDNPPFSILSEIVDFYVSRSVPFFLFAPLAHVLRLPSPPPWQGDGAPERLRRDLRERRAGADGLHHEPAAWRRLRV